MQPLETWIFASSKQYEVHNELTMAGIYQIAKSIIKAMESSHSQEYRATAAARRDGKWKKLRPEIDTRTIKEDLTITKHQTRLGRYGKEYA